MRDIHRELETLKGTEDPLDAVAERIATRYRLICFDEFHVTDIARRDDPRPAAAADDGPGRASTA